MTDRKLIIFVRAPRAGTVKTRIASTLGAKAALEIYLTLLEELFENLAGLRHVQLRFTPDDAGSEVDGWLRPGWERQPQGPGDLGSRMRCAILEASPAGTRRVVLIGSDCPAVTAQDVEIAWSNLESHDLVLGPAQDGGYWLVGATQPWPDLFQNIPWSTNRVLPETLRRADLLGLRTCLLRELSDIDTEADWRAFRARSGQPGA